MTDIAGNDPPIASIKPILVFRIVVQHPETELLAKVSLANHTSGYSYAEFYAL